MENCTTFPRIRKIWRQISWSATEFFPQSRFNLTSNFMSATFFPSREIHVSDFSPSHKIWRQIVCLRLNPNALKWHQRLKYWRQYFMSATFCRSQNLTSNFMSATFPRSRNLPWIFSSKLCGLSGTKIMLYYIVAGVDQPGCWKISALKCAGGKLLGLVTGILREWGRGVCAHWTESVVSKHRGGRVVDLGCRRSLSLVGVVELLCRIYTKLP